MLAVHEQSGGQVALKYLAPRLIGDATFVARFRDEARLLAGLTDPHLVRFYDYVESPYGAAIVMEAVPGVSLRAVLDRQGALEPEVALTLLKGSLLGLAAAHSAGVVHRDYKPENVLVPEDGTSKLADFGIAVPAGDAEFAGTPAYMAPEQWASGAVSPATDVYAATVVFFECLAGAQPYRGTTLDDWARAHRTAPVPVEGVPEPVRGLVAHGMAKTPAERPATAAAFVGELETAARAAYGKDWEKRGRKRLAALVAGLLALVPSPLTDLPPGGGLPGRALARKGLKGLLSKPGFVAPVAGLVTAGVVTCGVLVVQPWEPSGSEAGSPASPTPFVTPTEPPPDDDVIVIVRKRVEEKATASFSYEQFGCCRQQTWAWGDLESGKSGSSVYLDRVFNGSDAYYLKGKDPNYLIDPRDEGRVRQTRAYTVGDRSYVDIDRGWRSYTEASAQYERGDDPESRAWHYKSAAGSAFHTRAAVSPRHIDALLSTSDARPSTKKDDIVYRGSTTTAKVVAADPALAEVYGEDARYDLHYTLVLAPDYLPRELRVRMPTPGTNAKQWLYNVTYSGWGKGDPIEAPTVTASRETTAASPRPSAATSRP